MDAFALLKSRTKSPHYDQPDVPAILHGKLATAVGVLCEAVSGKGGPFGMMLSAAAPLVIRKLDEAPEEQQQKLLTSFRNLLDAIEDPDVSRETMIERFKEEMASWSSQTGE